MHSLLLKTVIPVDLIYLYIFSILKFRKVREQKYSKHELLFNTKLFHSDTDRNFPWKLVSPERFFDNVLTIILSSCAALMSDVNQL